MDSTHRSRTPRGGVAALKFQGAIFDVDGVLVDSPHSRAWRDALRELMDTQWADIRDRTSYSPDRFTNAVYQQVIAGLPRLAGARAALEHFGVPDASRRAELYAALKQEHMINLIDAGRFTAFPDALRLVLAIKAADIRVAAASSSKNASRLLRQIRLDSFAVKERLDNPLIRPGLTLLGLLDANVSGRDFPRGKPDPMIFLTAADELGAPPGRCFVIEDAVSGVQAAKSGGMAALGVARLGDEKALLRAGADLAVTTLDEVSRKALAEGRLRRRSASTEPLSRQPRARATCGRRDDQRRRRTALTEPIPGEARWPRYRPTISAGAPAGACAGRSRAPPTLPGARPPAEPTRSCCLRRPTAPGFPTWRRSATGGCSPRRSRSYAAPP
jgi:beta-phosphoglucomutase-like phosphatase (HAD superfamily)